MVSVADHSKEEAVTYYATNIEPLLTPYSWYLEHVLKGADEAGLPNEYVQKTLNFLIIPLARLMGYKSFYEKYRV